MNDKEILEYCEKRDECVGCPYHPKNYGEVYCRYFYPSPVQIEHDTNDRRRKIPNF